jgi:hypothetical protein
VHERDAAPHHDAAGGECEPAAVVPGHKPEREPRYDDRQDEGDDRHQQVELDRERNAVGEDRNEMHRPDPAARRESRGRKPGVPRRSGGQPYPAREVERGVGCKGRNEDRENNENGVVRPGDRHRNRASRWERQSRRFDRSRWTRILLVARLQSGGSRTLVLQIFRLNCGGTQAPFRGSARDRRPSFREP